ncbi:UNVERIFIED_CONTAM: hypothetical protein GTU68_010650 [Idotea baltica]|nr:hypothetical protein [Idotea baltica]
MLDIQQQVSLLKCNTLALPSTAEYFCKVSSTSELCEALSWARGKQLPIILLGGGSNVVLAGNLAGLVIHIAILGVELVAEQNTSSESDQRIVRVGAGENWHQLVLYTLEQGWYGLENLSLIPGLAGAAPIQNIGAYGVELSDRFHSLEAVELSSGDFVTMTASDCQFGYRDSFFKGAGRDQYAITAINLSLSIKADLCLEYPALNNYFEKNEPAIAITPKQVSDAVCAIRRTKLPDPKDIANAGSFFKNPVVSSEQMSVLQEQYPNMVSYDQANGTKKLAAGWLVEQAGWKGVEQSGVGVHNKQALVLVNYKGTGQALLSLAGDIQASVAEKFGITLEIEPRVYT